MSNTKRYAHMDAPECEQCENDTYVSRAEGPRDGWVCWVCGERTDVEYDGEVPE
jgi:hypothetical protein